MENRADNGGPGYRFGTFKGVFTPSILTILGVILPCVRSSSSWR